MEHKRPEFESLSVNELLAALGKNRYFILAFLLMGMTAGLFLSAIQYLRNPVIYRYQAVIKVDLIGRRGMDTQPRTFLNVIESKPMMDAALRKLRIESADYTVRTGTSSIPNRYEIYVEGPDEDNVLRLANDLVGQSQALVENSMSMDTNEVAEYAVPFEEPIPSARNIPGFLTIVMLTVLAGMLSLILIFFIRYLRGSIYTREQAEYILGTKLVVAIPAEKKKKTLRNMLKVR